MSKAAVQYFQLVYFYRLLLVRYLVLFNLVSLLAESLQEEEPSLDENPDNAKSRIEPVDCFEKGRIGQQVTGKELDEETGYYYFGARYYDPQVSMWISTDPAFDEYIPSGAQLFFPKEAFNANSLKGSGGIFNSKNMNLYHYGSINPLKFIDPDGRISTDVDPSRTFGYSDVGQRGRNGGEFHKGVDFFIPQGNSVHALWAGKVTSLPMGINPNSSDNGGAGNYLVIDHGDVTATITDKNNPDRKINLSGRLYSRYLHNSMNISNTGDNVNEGDVIGLTGNTGNSDGPHTHMEVFIVNSAGEKTYLNKDQIKELDQQIGSKKWSSEGEIVDK